MGRGRDLHLRDLQTGRDAKDLVPRVKFSDISWTRESKGFIYQRFKGTERSVAFAGANNFHQVWYHPVGGPDRLVFEFPQREKDIVSGAVSDDGRFLYLVAASGSAQNRLWIADLRDPKKPRLDAAPVIVAAEEDVIQRPLGVAEGRLSLYTTYQAPNGRIVSARIGDPDRAHWTTIVPETKDAIGETLLVGGTLVVARLVDVQSRVELFDLAGKPAGEVKLPEPGSALNLTGKTTGHDFFFEFTSYLRPRTVYRFDLKTRALEAFQPPVSPFDSAQYETRATFYPSKDGTRIPIFITARKARSG